MVTHGVNVAIIFVGAFIVNGASYLLALRMQSRRKHCVRWHVQKALKARITTTR